MGWRADMFGFLWSVLCLRMRSVDLIIIRERTFHEHMYYTIKKKKKGEGMVVILSGSGSISVMQKYWR